MKHKIPVIGVPMGDPAGIGPEIVVKALQVDELHRDAHIVVIGDRDTMLKAMDICQANIELKVISQVKDGNYRPGTINLMDMNNVDVGRLEYGKVQAMAGRAAFEYIKKAVDLAMAGEIHVLATTPINKEALKAGGINYIGHTEILADLTGTVDPLTMFEVDSLRVFFLSRHVSLREACDLVTKERVLDYIIRCHAALERLGIRGAKLAVAGLNPHCGENGLFGDEEVKEIAPAVEEARS